MCKCHDQLCGPFCLESNQGQFYLHFFSPFLRHLKLTWAFPDFFFFYLTTASLLTLVPSLSPPHLSIIVTPPLIHRQLSFLLAQSFRQPIYTVAGYIYLLEVWGAPLCLYSLPNALTAVPVAGGLLWIYPNLFASWVASDLAGTK